MSLGVCVSARVCISRFSMFPFLMDDRTLVAWFGLVWLIRWFRSFNPTARRTIDIYLIQCAIDSVTDWFYVFVRSLQFHRIKNRGNNNEWLFVFIHKFSLFALILNNTLCWREKSKFKLFIIEFAFGIRWFAFSMSELILCHSEHSQWALSRASVLILFVLA